MKFWGVEVKSGQPLHVKLGGRELHLCQASCGEIEGEIQESVIVEMIVNGKKLVLPTLEPRKRRQKVVNRLFDKDFTISHSLKNGSVYLLGFTLRKPFYKTKSDDEEEEEETAKKEEGHKASPATESSFHELEQKLKQMTLTRSEIQRLTALLHSKICDDVVVESDAITPQQTNKQL